jgi:hypothetical protein
MIRARHGRSRSKEVTASVGRSRVVCLEVTDPHNPSAFANGPNNGESQEAQLYRPGVFHAIKNVRDMKACLAFGYG